jgi:hypothetical protein
MIGYYAPGDGIGHLTRAMAVQHTLNLPVITILSDSPHARDARITGNNPIHPLAAFNDYDRLYTDAFPAGINGELANYRGDTVHIARRLHWQRYKAKITASPQIKTVFFTEMVDESQSAWLKAKSESWQNLELTDPPAPDFLQPKLPDRFWLIVAGYPANDTQQLIFDAYLQKCSHVPLILASLTPDVYDTAPVDAIINVYPILPLFETAERIFVSCSQAAFRQTKPYRHKTHYRVFNPGYDNHHARLTMEIAL